MKRGKLVCNTLKEIRTKIADANGIEYTLVLCEHQGDCIGTCPMCEAEVQYLEQELEKKKLAKESVNIIGVAEIDKDRLSDNMRCLDSTAFENKWKGRLMGSPAEDRIPELQGKLENVNVKRKRNWFQYLFDRFSASLFADDSL